MPFVFDASVGGPASNSYLTVAEFYTYLETAYAVVESPDALADMPILALATRTLNAALAPRRRLMRSKGEPPYYLIAPTWTGAPATATQALPWPRSGMYDRNGNAIATNVIPQELKDATAELARQFRVGDRTVDSEVAVQGVTSVRAGSVAVTFKDQIELQTIPSIVYDLLVPSWLTDEIIEPAWPAQFDVVS